MGRSRTYMSLLGITVMLVLLFVGAVELDNTNNEDVDDNNSILPATRLPDSVECHCQCRSHDPTPQPARIAYLVTVHNNRTVQDALFLFRAIRSPSNIIMIHVDKKLDWSVYTNSTLYKEVEACPCGSHVVVESIHDSKWSSWSMNDPTFWGMELAATRFRGEWHVFMNLSGDTMPVYTTEIMARLFDPTEGRLRGMNFVTSSSCETGLVPTSVYYFPEHWHKRAHYTTNPKGDPVIAYKDDNGKKQTIRLVTHFGSQWMALQPSFVHYLVDSLRRNDSLPSRYKDELIRTKRLMTDETFIPTLLMHVHPFNMTLPVLNQDGTLKTLPTMSAIRYERMDEHVPTAFGKYATDQRYEVPKSSIADQPKVWGPYFLGVYDLGNLKDSGALFVRKVSVSLDPNIVHLLPVTRSDEIPNIYWPHEVKVSPKPDWEKRIKEAKEQAKAEKLQKLKEAKEKEEEVKEVKEQAKAEKLQKLKEAKEKQQMAKEGKEKEEEVTEQAKAEKLQKAKETKEKEEDVKETKEHAKAEKQQKLKEVKENETGKEVVKDEKESQNAKDHAKVKQS